MDNFLEKYNRKNETKSCFLEKINKIDKPLARLNKKKRESTHINRIRNENRKVTMDTTELQRIVREYYENGYANKLENLEEMDNFLEKYNLLRMTQEETENLNRPITSNEIELVIKNYEKTKDLNQVASLLNCIKHLVKT